MGVSGPSGPCSRLRAGSLWPQRELPSLCFRSVLWACLKGSVTSHEYAYPSGDPRSSMACSAHDSFPFPVSSPFQRRDCPHTPTSSSQSPTTSHPERLQPASKLKIYPLHPMKWEVPCQDILTRGFWSLRIPCFGPVSSGGIQRTTQIILLCHRETQISGGKDSTKATEPEKELGSFGTHPPSPNSSVPHHHHHHTYTTVPSPGNRGPQKTWLGGL